jgi:predicted ATP-grasp superfamily ATP-dependent carboligase
MFPETQQLNRASDLKGGFEFPWIVKPALAASCIGGQMGRGRAYRIVDAEGQRRLATGPEIDQPMLVQPVISGVGEGVFGFALPDRVVCWSGHRRIRMMNPAGSGASACISVMPEPETCAIAEKFIKTIRWRGMFMVELLRATDGKLWFMELNGRAWGSMALAEEWGSSTPHGQRFKRSMRNSFLQLHPTGRPWSAAILAVS